MLEWENIFFIVLCFVSFFFSSFPLSLFRCPSVSPSVLCLFCSVPPLLLPAAAAAAAACCVIRSGVVRMVQNGLLLVQIVHIQHIKEQCLYQIKMLLEFYKVRDVREGGSV